MIDFFASTTIALIVIMTLVLFFSNQRQAGILKQMRLIMDDWYKAQMRDRRAIYKEKIQMPDVLQWMGSQVDLTVIEQARKLENPPALEFLTAEGSRLVVSPFPKRKMRSALRSVEGKRRKVSKLVQPLLGYRPGKIKAIERSNRTIHEWYEVEIETALEKLGLNWLAANSLFFYVIPSESEKAKAPIVSLDTNALRFWLTRLTVNISGWFKERQTSQPVVQVKIKKKAADKRKSVSGNESKKGVRMDMIMRMVKDRKGATMAEYAVIAAVLILVAIVAFTSLGTTIVAKIGDLVSGM